jgi:hypothetical protein
MKNTLAKDPGNLFPPEVRNDPVQLAATTAELKATLHPREGRPDRRHIRISQVQTEILKKLANDTSDNPLIKKFKW